MKNGTQNLLRPMGDRVLIRPIPESKVTDGGLHIPGNAEQTSTVKRGKVLAVGKGDKLKDGSRGEMFCRPGDEVLYRSNPNQEYEMEAENGEMAKCAVINEEQFLLAVID